jgi:hypothetical protein
MHSSLSFERIMRRESVPAEDSPNGTFRVLRDRLEGEHGVHRTPSWPVPAAYDEFAKTDRFAGEKRESAIEVPKNRSIVPVKQ